MKKVAVLKRGDFYIYAYDLITELAAGHMDVTAIISIDKTEENPIYDDLLNKIKGRVKCTRLVDIPRRFYLRLKSILNKFNLSSDYLIVSPYLIYKTRRKFRDEPFDCIIAIGQESLFWAYKSFKKLRHKIIYYNLQLIYKGHPLAKADRTWNRIVSFERKTLSKIFAIIIQDKFRAGILFGGVEHFEKIRVLYFPVCINETIVLTKGSYLTRKFGISEDDFVILYFGGIWQGRYLGDIISQAKTFDKKDKIVIHGGRGSFIIESDDPNIIISSEKLLFSEVTNLISSAHIGLAFYPRDNYNDMYTAFSSEKISRYCQCGIPFIAFENENYLFFKNKYDCCILIKDIEQLKVAIIEIKSQYSYYRENAYKAFKNEFDFKKQIGQIISFIDDNC